LAVTVAICAVVGFRYFTPDASSSNANLARLAGLVGTHRFTHARLTGGFAYAPCEGDSASDSLVHGLACNGSPARTWAGTRKFSNFVADLTAKSSLDPQTAGVWKLIWDKSEDAVADLRAAAKRDPGNARVLNDLAVALTRYAQQHDNPSALIDAFVAVDSAVQLDASLVEARFTRALLLEKLYLRTDAIAAWNHYLELDRRSRWADEAREHIAGLRPKVGTVKSAEERLRRAVAARDSQAIRLVVAEEPADIRVMVHEELAAWGDAFTHNDSSGARSHLDFGRIVADRFRVETGDAMLSDAVAAIDQAVSHRDSRVARALADGHVALVAGIRDFESSNTKRDTVELRNAHRLLSTGRSAMRYWALLYMARAGYATPEAFGYLTAIRDSAPEKYAGVRSIAAQNLGLTYDTRYDLLHVLPAYDSALTENRATREPNVALRVGAWLALGQGVLQGKDVSWRTEYQTLAASFRFPTKYQALVTVFDHGAKATQDDAPRLALLYSSEAVRFADSIKNLQPPVYTRTHRAEWFARLGQIADAQKDIDSAKALVRSGNPSRNLKADVLLADAHIALYSAAADVEPKILEVIDQFRTSKYDRGLPAAYLYLAQSRGAAGNIAAARAAFDSATALMQRQRATLSSYAERSAFLDAMRSVVDLTVAFHAEHDSTEAFEFFEGTRSRVLLEQLADGGAPELTDRRPMLGALRSRLAKDDVVLSYAVLPKELLIWTITRDGFSQHRVPVSSSRLEELVQQFRQSLLSNVESSPDSASSQLYRLLVESAGAIQHGANLIVIPDQWLHYVPFAALRDPSTGKYLIRDHSLRYEPSATLLLSKLEAPTQHFSRASRILAIGNPTFDERTFQLRPLPEAKGEADRIAGLYASRALTGRDATDSAFQRMSPKFDILHFAGHAIVGRNAAQLSHLVLAPQGRSDGAVFSSEIARWKLPKTRLVVLSGCSTADGKLSATEGASSLARAFFAAGVPAVVSSFWAIEDDDTADFFVEFHTLLVNGVSPATALRETQIKWLGSRPVRSWAAFQLFGG
jgi:CHAT domain-containing protein